MTMNFGVLDRQRHPMGRVGNGLGPETHQPVIGVWGNPLHLEAEGFKGCAPMVVVGISPVGIPSRLGALDGTGHQVHPLLATDQPFLDQDVSYREGFGLPGILKDRLSLFFGQGRKRFRSQSFIQICRGGDIGMYGCHQASSRWGSQRSMLTVSRGSTLASPKTSAPWKRTP